MIRFQWDEIVLEFLHEDVPGSENMTPVFRASNNDESNLVEMLVLFSPESKQFYWITGRGCACCTTLTDTVTSVEDLTKGDERAVKRAVREFMKEFPDILSEADKEKIFSKIKKCK